MGRHVVVGAGGIGRGCAAELAGLGHEVLLLSRSGTDPGLPGVTADRVDAADGARLTALSRGADTIVNAVNPPYTRWATDWPPMSAGLLAAAEATGAGLVIVGNLYGYGRVSGPMTEHQPLAANGTKGRVRATMWEHALAAHRAGRIRALEIRASDYFGPGATPRMSYLNEFVLRPAVTGKRIRLLVGHPDAPHSWTYLPDICRTVAAAISATPADAWGHPWHVPSAPPRSVREVVADLARVTGRPAVRVGLLPAPVRWGLRRAVPLLRELAETAHQFENPFILDASHTSARLGVIPTPWPDSLTATAAALSGSTSASGPTRVGIGPN